MTAKACDNYHPKLAGGWKGSLLHVLRYTQALKRSKEHVSTKNQIPTTMSKGMLLIALALKLRNMSAFIYYILIARFDLVLYLQASCWST